MKGWKPDRDDTGAPSYYHELFDGIYDKDDDFLIFIDKIVTGVSGSGPIPRRRKFKESKIIEDLRIKRKICHDRMERRLLSKEIEK